jgi:hypothetical protein
VCLVCTGALTNAALLLLLYPEVIPMIEIVLMGGCMGTGNTGPVVEFNIQVSLPSLQMGRTVFFKNQQTQSCLFSHAFRRTALYYKTLGNYSDLLLMRSIVSIPVSVAAD